MGSKTLLISEIFPPLHGGSGRWFFELYRRLPRDEYAVVAGSTPGSSEVDKRFGDEISVIRLPLSSENWGIKSLQALKFYFGTFSRLSRLVKSEKISEVHCGRCLPEGVLGLMLKLRFGVRLLCYVHGEDVQAASESRELSWVVSRVFGHCDQIVANSENTAEILTSKWRVFPEKLVVLHPGMDATVFRPAEPNPAFSEAMGWTGKTVLLTVGRLQRRKGHDMLIRSLPGLTSAHPELLYAIVGDGEQAQELRQLSHDLGVDRYVQFLNELDDHSMIQCYQNCNLFVLPNRTDGADIEGFGMVLVEAQACGKAVVAGDSGGTRETMHPGVTGRIVDCTSHETLQGTLDELLADPGLLRRMGAKGREFVVDRFDWPNVAAKAKIVFSTRP